MKQVGLILLGILLFVCLIIGLSYGFGWIGVHQTKTIKKAQEDANREVFENTQSYIEGKRQEAVKYRLEYLQAETETEKNAIRSTIRMSFANFDESKLNSPELEAFVETMKYSTE